MRVSYKNSLNVRWNRLFCQFWSESDEVSFIKSEFSSVSIKVSKVEMDSTPSSFIRTPKLSKFNNYIIQVEFLLHCIENLPKNKFISSNI